MTVKTLLAALGVCAACPFTVSAQDVSVAAATSHAAIPKLSPVEWQFGTNVAVPPPQGADQGRSLLLRFDLIAPTPGKTESDPAIAELTSALKDLFRFPGYRLLSSAAMSVDYVPLGPGKTCCGAMTSQMISAEGHSYQLTIIVDSAGAQSVRLHVRMASMPETAKGARGGTAPSMSAEREVFFTQVTVTYGHTVVLGSTQPDPTAASSTDSAGHTVYRGAAGGTYTFGRGSRIGGSTTGSGTLILAVRPELRAGD